MKTEIAIIKTTQLEEVVQNAGLAIQEGEEIKKSYLPFLNQLAEAQSSGADINFESPGIEDESLARELRLKTVKIRTGAEALKESRKKIHLLKGNLEQAAFNIIAASCKLTEEIFVNVEKAREIAEKKRKEELRVDRWHTIQQYSEIEPTGLGDMAQDVFDNYVAGLKLAYDTRIAAEKKAEKDRIAKEKADAKERELQRLENIRLKKEAEDKAIRDTKRNQELRPYIIFIRDYSNMLSLPDAEYEKELADIKKGAEEHWEFERKESIRKQLEEETARRERDIAKAKLKMEADRVRKEAAELQAKQQAVVVAQKEAEAKVLAEQKAKAAAERKAKNATDKVKLTTWLNQIQFVPTPVFKSEESQAIAIDITTKFAAFKKWANQQIEAL